jgi:hypothetical protein
MSDIVGLQDDSGAHPDWLEKGKGYVTTLAIGGPVDPSTARWLEEVFGTTAITHVKLGPKNLSLAGTIHLFARAMLSSAALTSLELDNSQINADDARFLAQHLADNRHLIHLSLSSSPLGDTGVIALSAALEHNVALSHLNLSSTQFTFLGAQAISRLLVANSTLVELNIGGS